MGMALNQHFNLMDQRQHPRKPPSYWSVKHENIRHAAYDIAAKPSRALDSLDFKNQLAYRGPDKKTRFVVEEMIGKPKNDYEQRSTEYPVVIVHKLQKSFSRIDSTT